MPINSKSGSTPEYLQPKMDGTPVSEPAIYRSLYILESLTTYLEGSPDPTETQEKIQDVVDQNNKIRDEERELGSIARSSYNFLNRKQNRALLIELYTRVQQLPVFDSFRAEYPETLNEIGSDILGENTSDRTFNAAVATFLQTTSAYREKISAKRQELEVELNEIRNTIPSRDLAHSNNQEMLDPFDNKANAAIVQTEPAIGVLTVHHQGWVQKGLALGNLLQSVCLAPGEVTQVAVVDWQRTVSGTQSEELTQGEVVASEIDQSRAVNEVQNAVAREAQSGGSSMTSSSGTVQAGANVATLFASATVSGSTTETSALAAQFSLGSRELAAESSNALTQSTAEKSQSLRSRRASVVREVSEREAETLSSRVLANYNRRHTLNVEYFEALQLYEIKTRLAGWERCLFLPLQPIDFSKNENIQTHKAALVRLFSKSNNEIARYIADYDVQSGDDKDARGERRTNLVKGIAGISQAIDGFRGQLASMPTEKPHERALAAMLEQQVRQLEAQRGELEHALTVVSLPLPAILQDHSLEISQFIWLRMDPFRIYAMIKDLTVDGRPLSSLVDPHPVGVFGNYVAFRWGFERSESGDTARKEFEKKYLKTDSEIGEDGLGAETSENAVESEGVVVALPTSGVFAEAVLGQGEAAETIDETKFWRWDEEPIPILPPKIADISSRDRAKGMDLSGSDFASALAVLRAKNPNDISHIASVLGEIGKGDMFRNMGGMAEAAALAQRAAELSGEGAGEAGKRAADLQAKVGDTMVKMVEEAGKLLEGDAAQALVAEAMLPGAGPAILQAAKGVGGAKSPTDALTQTGVNLTE